MEWLVLTVATFLLYLVLWLPFIRQFYWSYGDIIKDFVYCGVFILSSLTIESFVLKRNDRISHTKLLANGIATLVLNMLLALLYEMYLSDLLWPDSPKEESLYSVYIFCVISSIVSQFHTIRYYVKIIIQQQRENNALKMKMLKTQLNPHFIFNSLNILSGLVDEDPQRAESFIVSLSKIYRYIVKGLDEDTVAVSEAVGWTKEYVSIMQMRYPSSIVFDVSGLDGHDGGKILTMGMQLLIENAVKHNSPSPETPLRISIDRRGDCLVVGNSINAESQRGRPCVFLEGLGLENLKRRYLLVCDKEPKVNVLSRGGVPFFEVSLPII